MGPRYLRQQALRDHGRLDDSMAKNQTDIAFDLGIRAARTLHSVPEHARTWSDTRAICSTYDQQHKQPRRQALELKETCLAFLFLCWWSSWSNGHEVLGASTSATPHGKASMIFSQVQQFKLNALHLLSRTC